MEEFDEYMCHEEFDTMKKLILLQLQRIEETKTLDEAKAITRELKEALE